MTGRIPARSGLTRPLLASDRPTKNPWADEVSAAKLLSAGGYVTGLSGKWHIGEGEGMQPQQVGFDEFHGFLSVVSEYTQYMDDREYGQLMLNPDRLTTYKSQSEYNAVVEGTKGGQLRPVYPLDTAERWEIPTKTSLTGQSVLSIEQRRRRSHSIWFTPLQESISITSRASGRQRPQPWKAPRTRMRSWRWTTSSGSWPMATLQETGQADNTFVFFLSDNGPEEDTYPDSGFTPFRGGKGTTWEGGVRVPGIAYWPGMIKPARVSDGLFDVMDLFNTSLALGGVVDKIPT